MSIDVASDVGQLDALATRVVHGPGKPRFTPFAQKQSHRTIIYIRVVGVVEGIPYLQIVKQLTGALPCWGVREPTELVHLAFEVRKTFFTLEF